ncbi:hypothetical protein F4861DRAFT_194841 [Xylaria intraflava]|nr:hypothetical protein F4861DRAFT_194841 [Xylaria intraflava]
MPVLSKPQFLDLPFEIVDKIILDGNLSVKDLKALRLTCKGFAAMAKTATLYHTVAISRLKEDRDKFVGIASIPQLAKYVRQIVWHDLDLETWWAAQSLYAAWPVSQQAAAVDISLFWIPCLSTNSNGNLWIASEVLAEQLSDCDWIANGVVRMPNLTTITVRPMPFTRSFRRRDITYMAGHFAVTGSLVDGMYGSLGLKLMLPTLHQQGCRVRALNIEENPTRRTLAALSLDDMNAFKNLTSISICFGLDSMQSEQSWQPLMRCLQSANKLQTLKICFQQAMRTCHASDGAAQTFVNLLFSVCCWPHLSTLQLVNRKCAAPRNQHCGTMIQLEGQPAYQMGRRGNGHSYCPALCLNPSDLAFKLQLCMPIPVPHDFNSRIDLKAHNNAIIHFRRGLIARAVLNWDENIRVGTGNGECVCEQHLHFYPTHYHGFYFDHPWGSMPPIYLRRS